MGFAPLLENTPVIERAVPIPPSRAVGSFGGRKYPWLEMKIGDSFLVQKPQKKFGNSVWNAEQRYGIKLSTRSVMVNSKKCTRVWRVG